MGRWIMILILNVHVGNSPGKQSALQTQIIVTSQDHIFWSDPSDIRMDIWADASGHNTFNIGTDPISIFPSILMRGTNGHTYINFNPISPILTHRDKKF